MATLHKTIEMLGQCLRNLGTDPALAECIIQYEHSRGGETMTDICFGIARSKEVAKAQDTIGWRQFLDGMITSKLVEAQEEFQQREGGIFSIDAWASGFVIKLLECTHGQWLYQNVVVHDGISGSLVTARKEDIQAETGDQREWGAMGLCAEDEYLLEINLEDLEVSSGESQQYWLLAIRAARVAHQLAEEETGGVAVNDLAIDGQE